MKAIEATELSRAKDLLQSGQVVAIPTETVYGLAASIESEVGLKKIFSLKERPFFDPLIVHVASLKQAAALVREFPPVADFLARMFWPGPLTLVLPKAAHVNPLITSGLETVAIRFPDHPVALELIRLLGVPLAAPSANKFGRTSPSRAEHVRAEFPNEDLLILDGGECEVGVESTVLALQLDDNTGGECLRILRPGGVTEEMLREALTKWLHPVQIVTSADISSPGHMKHHYMPKIPLVIVDIEQNAPLTAQNKLDIQNALGKNFSGAAELVLAEDPALAARELYAEMRRLSESRADFLFVRKSPERSIGLWSAIWDRLEKASTLVVSKA